MNDEDNGMIYFCATPIGNLEDITLRVLKTLKEADIIAAEDTRHTLKLLNHYDIKKPLISYHEHNKFERGDEIVQMVKDGKKIAVVSDAGMPAISDPGYELVKAAVENDLKYTVLPGPSASLTALVLSGFPTDRFVFEGFLPREKSLRNDRIEILKREKATIIMYESPYRVKNTLIELYKALGDRKVALVREVSKIYEEVRRFQLRDINKETADETFKGEFVIIIEGFSEEKSKNNIDENLIADRLKFYLSEGLSKKDAVSKVAKELSVPKNTVYSLSIDI